MDKIFEDRQRLFDYSEDGCKPMPIGAGVVAYYDPSLGILCMDMEAWWGDMDYTPHYCPTERRDLVTVKGYSQAELWQSIIGRMQEWYNLVRDFPNVKAKEDALDQQRGGLRVASGWGASHE